MIPQADPPASTGWPCGGAIAEAEPGLRPLRPHHLRHRGGARARRPGRRRHRRAAGCVVATDLTASAWRLDAPAPVVPTPAGAAAPRGDAPRRGPRGAARQPLGRRRWPPSRSPPPGAHGYRIGVTVNGEGVEAARDVPLSLRVGAGKDERTARAVAARAARLREHEEDAGPRLRRRRPGGGDGRPARPTRSPRTTRSRWSSTCPAT